MTSGKVGEKLYLVRREGEGDFARCGEGEGAFCGGGGGISQHERKGALPFGIVAVHLSLFGVSAEKAGGREHVEVALRKSELFRRDLPFVPVHHRGREIELGKPAPAHHTAFEIGAEAAVRERDGLLAFA